MSRVIGAVVEPFAEHAEAEIQHMLSPVVFVVAEPLFKLVAQRRELEEVMLAFAQHWGSAADLAPRSDQIRRVELAATVIALITPCLVVVAVRAGALNVAIRKEALRFGVEVERLRCRVEVARVEQAAENVLRDGCMVGGGGGCEEIE